MPKRFLRKFFPNYYYKILKLYRLMRNYIKPVRSPRVYIKRGITRMEFFEILHKRKIEYVLLRWWENLPEIPDGEDMDILIKDEHRELIRDLLTYKDNGTGLMCDIYTVTGSKFGSHRGLPYFTFNLANTLLKSRVLYKGAFVPSPKAYFASLGYHAVFHKGLGSGLPGFYDRTDDMEHDYTTLLSGLAKKLGTGVNITVTGIYNWLKEQGYAPADDTLTKLVEIKPELSLLQKPLFSDVRGGDLIVYVIRERIVKDGLLNDFRVFLEEEFHFDVLDVRILNINEKNICSRQIRGGNWDQGPYKYSGGSPLAFITVFDYRPCPLDDEDIKKQPRMTNNNNINAKYRYREKVTGMKLKKNNYNGVHSSDNEQDAWYYISLLGDRYRKRIINEVEGRRNVLSQTNSNKISVRRGY